jgi:hypothetical protein
MDKTKVFSCALATIAMCVSVFALYRAHQFDAFAWRLVRQNSGTSEIVVEYLGEVQQLRDRVEQLERNQQPRTKEAATMNDENERSVGSGGYVAGEPVAWAALREDGSVYACHQSRDMVVAVAGDRKIVGLWIWKRGSFLSPEPVAYCWETALHGWEIASPAAAAEEPELHWKKMVVQ